MKSKRRLLKVSCIVLACVMGIVGIIFCVYQIQRNTAAQEAATAVRNGFVTDKHYNLNSELPMADADGLDATYYLTINVPYVFDGADYVTSKDICVTEKAYYALRAGEFYDGTATSYDEIAFKAELNKQSFSFFFFWGIVPSVGILAVYFIISEARKNHRIKSQLAAEQAGEKIIRVDFRRQ